MHSADEGGQGLHGIPIERQESTARQGTYRRCVRRGAMASALLLVSAAATAQAADKARASVEVRISPPFVRPIGSPSLCPMLAVPVADHWLVGGGYELVQDYEAGVRTSNDTYVSPMVMSGLRLGGWYRSGRARHAISFAIGGLVTLSHPCFSIAKSPAELDGGSYIFDLGLDLAAGYVWERFRLEVFAIPAWSAGHISTPAMTSTQRWSGFTPRVGLALAWVI